MGLDENKMRRAGKGLAVHAVGHAVIQLLRSGQTLDVGALQDHLRAQIAQSPAHDSVHYSQEAALQELQAALESTARKSML